MPFNSDELHTIKRAFDREFPKVSTSTHVYVEFGEDDAASNCLVNIAADMFPNRSLDMTWLLQRVLGPSAPVGLDMTDVLTMHTYIMSKLDELINEE